MRGLGGGFYLKREGLKINGTEAVDS